MGGWLILPALQSMPCVEIKKSDNRTISVYFDKEEEREKYEDYSVPITNICEVINKNRRKVYQQMGDRQAMVFYKREYEKGKWFGDYTPNQIKKIYKEVL